MDKSRVINEDPTLFDIASKTVRRSTRLSSSIVTILMLILAGAALVSKWSIIQSIHNEIVHKYQTDQPVYYEQNSICNIMNQQQFNLLTFPVACFLILLFIIQTKRTSLLRDKCYGYGGPPIPVDFISHIDRKFAAVVYAICADELIAIMEQVLNGNSPKGDGVIVIYLLRILQVIVMGFRYYPLLAAVYMDTIFTLSCATIYAWLDYSVTIVNQGMCQVDYYPTYDDYLDNSSNIQTMFDFYGTGRNLIAIQLCTDIPRYLCLAYISVKLPMLLIKKIYFRVKKNMPLEMKILEKLTREQRTFFYICRSNSVEMLYVKNLFRSAEHRPRSRALFARLIPTKIYEWRDDFRFSTRVLCVYSSIALLLYFVSIQAFILVLPELDAVQKVIQQFMDVLTPLFLPSSDATTDNGEPQDINSNTSNFPIPSLVRPYIFAVFLTLIIIITQLVVLLVNMRRNLFQSYRGDDSELPRRQRSKYTSLSSGNIHFAGYFIGYLIWGFIIIAVFSALICISIDAFIIFGSVRLIEIILKAIIPTLLFVFFKQYLNRVLAQYVFLQHHGEVLSLNNRRLLMIFIYFNFFLDAFLGFVSSIVRLIKSVLGGIMYMCRLDYSPLGRKLETMDGGFSAYCGFIHTECAHRHPVMLVFVSHLYTQMKMKQLAMENMEIDDIKRTKSSSRYIRKWKLAVFLARNPTIVFFRKAFLNQLHIDEIHALNDIHNDDKKSNQKRISIYTRRMSMAPLSTNSITISEPSEKRRLANLRKNDDFKI
jgi:hypothetical protein